MKYTIEAYSSDWICRSWAREVEELGVTKELSHIHTETNGYPWDTTLLPPSFKELTKEGVLAHFFSFLNERQRLSFVNKKLHFIGHFYVRTNHRGEGVGQEMLEAIEEELRQTGVDFCLIYLGAITYIHPILQTNIPRYIQFFERNEYFLLDGTDTWLIKPIT